MITKTNRMMKTMIGRNDDLKSDNVNYDDGEEREESRKMESRVPIITEEADFDFEILFDASTCNKFLYSASQASKIRTTFPVTSKPCVGIEISAYSLPKK